MPTATPATAAPADATIVLPPLTDGEASVLFVATNLFRSLIDQASVFSSTAEQIRDRLGDVSIRAAVVTRCPWLGGDGLVRVPALTREEYRFVRLALENLSDGLGHLLVYGDLGRDRMAPFFLLDKISGLAAD